MSRRPRIRLFLTILAYANALRVGPIRAFQSSIRRGSEWVWCGLSTDEEALIRAASGPDGGTYGEITAVGFRTLMRTCGLGPSDTFADLGSGFGSAVLQAASEFNVRHACGVELAPSRHRAAVRAWEEAEPDVRERVRLVEGDAAEASGVLEETTVVWLSNLLFGPPLQARLSALVADAPTVRLVAVLKKFPDGPPRGFVEDDCPVLCQMSWTNPGDGVNPPAPGHPCVVYRRADE